MNPAEYDRMRAAEDHHWWYVGTRAIARDFIADLELPPGALILDAGCGTGGNAAMLSRFGHVVGVDYSPLAVGYAARRGLPRLTQASVLSLPFGDGTFDLVTSFDVLYHRSIGDDVAAMRELARVLKPGGHLYVRVAALKWLRGAHDEVVHGARRYTASELRRKLTTASLAPTRVTYVTALLLPFAAARRAMDRLFGGTPSDVAEPPPLIDSAFRVAMALERRLLQRLDLPLGVSVTAVARKRG